MSYVRRSSFSISFLLFNLLALWHVNVNLLPGRRFPVAARRTNCIVVEYSLPILAQRGSTNSGRMTGGYIGISHRGSIFRFIIADALELPTQTDRLGVVTGTRKMIT
jgi:hypothetical protein